MTSATVEAVGGSGKEKGKNIYVLGLIARMFDLDVAKLTQLIKERFGGKNEDIVRNALLAFDAGYAYPAENLRNCLYRLEKSAVANARTAGHHRRQHHPRLRPARRRRPLRRRLPDHSVVLHHGDPPRRAAEIRRHLRAGEDEIAAVSTALGFAYGGHLSITGSSGPGLSLKMEALGWATMAEIPLIVINVQRGGPSTGLPTNIEQSDLMQAIYGSHGDTPRVVLAPKNVEDCFYIAIEAARIAREYSTPVLILTDQAIATRIEAFDEPDLAKLMVQVKPDLQPRAPDFKPYPLGRPHPPRATRAPS